MYIGAVGIVPSTLEARLCRSVCILVHQYTVRYTGCALSLGNQPINEKRLSQEDSDIYYQMTPDRTIAQQFTSAPALNKEFRVVSR